ncbi:MAG: hypothetical protein H7Y12_09640 [Sphingobacteriaceae bacterium]|nr:hypothetical protein [Cytophagaceae bacterium]
MKKLLLLLLLPGLLAACKKKEDTPVKEVIAKKWTAKQVDENSTVVYTKGATNNIRLGYTQFLLDLSSPTAVTYREFDANDFTGTWDVVNNEKLVLSNLTPQPTGSNGTLEFTINSASATELVLTRLTASGKTGGSTNKYTLANP